MYSTNYTTYTTTDVTGLQGVLGMLMGMMIIFMVLFWAILIFSYVCSWKINVKLGKPGWACLIPFYCNYVIFDAVWNTREFWRMLIFAGAGILAYVLGIVLAIACGILEYVGLVFLLASFVLSILVYVWEIKKLHHLSLAFGHSGAFTIGLIFLSLIFYAILAFSKQEQPRLVEYHDKGNGYVPNSEPYRPGDMYRRDEPYRPQEQDRGY